MQNSQKIPYLLRKPRVRRGPKRSENGWQNPKRLAVRLAEIGSLQVTQPESVLFDRIEPIEHCVGARSPHGSEHGQAHTWSRRVPRVRGEARAFRTASPAASGPPGSSGSLTRSSRVHPRVPGAVPGSSGSLTRSSRVHPRGSGVCSSLSRQPTVLGGITLDGTSSQCTVRFAALASLRPLLCGMHRVAVPSSVLTAPSVDPPSARVLSGCP